MLGEDVEEENAEKLSPKDEKRAFNNQHVFKRMAIVAAGPLFNMFLALALFCGMFIVSGDTITTAEVGKVLDDSPAYRAGLKQGDVITAIDGKAVTKWDEIKGLIQDKAGKPISITVQREGEAVNLTITPEEATGTNEFGEEKRTVQIGIGSAYKTEKVELNPLQAIVEGGKYTWMWVKLTCLVVVKLFEGVVSVKTLTGPLGIAGITGEIAKENPMNLIPFSAIISINLGILNLFPIPILDGGLIVFLIIELIMGRPLSLRKREMAQRIGFSLLIALMILVFYNDILRMFRPTP
jgi:regulator of sigma E protease